MSAEECEKVFGGTWTLVNSENLDQFIIASGMLLHKEIFSLLTYTNGITRGPMVVI